MSKDVPDYHSPLQALGRKVLLWGVLPAVLVAAALYVLATPETPDQAEQRRTVEEQAKMLGRLRK